MLRLDQIYFRSFFTLFFITLFITATLGYFLLKEIEIKNHKTMLKNMIEQFTIQKGQNSRVEDIIKEIKKRTSIRVTVINFKGEVLYESDRNIVGMQNHIDRPEIKESNYKDIGFSVRFSDSVGRDFLYVAKKSRDRYIRMAYALDSIKEKFFNFWLKAIGLFALAMVVSFWIAIKIQQRVSRDLKIIKVSLENLLKKRYKIDNRANCCIEFETISKQIEKVSSKLKKRDRQKAKYTKNLKLLNSRQKDIISAISHEFKNPIAAIVGYTQSIIDDRDLDIDTRDKFLKKVLKNSQKMTSMIDKLSLAIKVKNDSFKLEFSSFRLDILIEDISQMLLQRYIDRKVTIEVDNIYLKADRVMFENLLTNLIENALKYSKDDVTVRVKDKKLEVIDRGVGIDKDDIKHITKRFFRANSQSWDNSIGVGLYISKYILKLHKIELNIDSFPKKGSIFWFDISNIIYET